MTNDNNAEESEGEVGETNTLPEDCGPAPILDKEQVKEEEHQQQEQQSIHQQDQGDKQKVDNSNIEEGGRVTDDKCERDDEQQLVHEHNDKLAKENVEKPKEDGTIEKVEESVTGTVSFDLVQDGNKIDCRLTSDDTMIAKEYNSNVNVGGENNPSEQQKITATLPSDPDASTAPTELTSTSATQNTVDTTTMEGRQPEVNGSGSQEKVDNDKQNVEGKEGDERSSCEIETSRIRVGICAMDKKAKSKPMGEILSRLDKEIFTIVYFGDYMILNMEVEQWPICDVLIAFHSAGYPLEKAEKYASLHPNIFILNDLKMQRVLMDRRRVYDLLEASGIDVPRHVFMNRDGYVSMTDTAALTSNNSSQNHYSKPTYYPDHYIDDEDSMNSRDNYMVMDDSSEENGCELIEHDDHIEVNGVVIHKPFVEKPVDADDHNIAIYYPYSAGGGCKKLFRKIGDRSSEFYPHINEVRREGSFIYEEFVETQGTDVKMYTVGPDYGHAEARKSPAVDGKVERNADGKEVRFPIFLTLREKEIARRIVMVFKQHVCGFDLLRVQEGDSLVSYVCDVNGWSFVKKSKKYYEDCAQILTEHMLAAVKPGLLHGFSALNPLLTKVKDSVVDTPKRRRQQRAFSRSFSDTLVGSPDKSDDQNSTTTLENSAFTLAEGAAPVRQMPDMIMDDGTASSIVSTKTDDETMKSKVTQTHQEELRCVITVVRHGDRTPKQKLKLKMSEPLLLQYFHDHADNFRKELKVKDKKPMTQFLATVKETIAQKQEEGNCEQNSSGKKKEIMNKLKHMRDVLERWKIGGLNRKLQMKPTKWDEFQNEDGIKIFQCTELQLILKWGGNLTKLGEKQAFFLGKRLRQEVYPDEAGGGILRLHSTFRHDLKIKTSDEGRVMKTAAAFAKGLLELEGEITPILVSLVHKERNSHHMLDPSGNKEVKKELEACKVEINKNLQKDFDVDKASSDMVETIVGPSSLKSLHGALKGVGNPRKTLFEIRAIIGDLLDQLDEMLGGMTSDMENKNEGGEGLRGDEDTDETLSGITLYRGETLLELTERWRLLHTKLYDEDDDEFDLSRVPDVHDNVRFDMLHNPHLGLTVTLEKLYKLAKLMADCVVPQEYGITIEEKRGIGNKMCGALLEKLLFDLIIARTDNQVDMRFMINHQYSADLPINTMGRRVRTRLYFTSESHLHTLLNVLRFASSDPSSKATNPLSAKGIEIVSNAPELCYLTQIVIRLFENTSKDEDDPKRFRIEIFFSPGATATPLHMSELERDSDASRFDTEPLQLISKPYLTCKELEEYFQEAISEGKPGDDDDDNATLSLVEQSVIDQQNYSSKEGKERKGETLPLPVKKHSEEVNLIPNTSETSIEDKGAGRIKFVTISEEKNTHISFNDDSAHSGHSGLSDDHPKDSAGTEDRQGTENARKAEVSSGKILSREEKKEEKNCKVNTSDDTNASDEDDQEDLEKVKEMAIVLGRQYFWTSVAAVSFVLGIGCLILSREIIKSDTKTRRWSSR